MNITSKQLAEWIKNCEPISQGSIADAGELDRGNFHRELQKENPSIKPESITKMVDYLAKNGIKMVLPADSAPKKAEKKAPATKKGSAGQSGGKNEGSKNGLESVELNPCMAAAKKATESYRFKKAVKQSKSRGVSGDKADRLRQFRASR